MTLDEFFSQERPLERSVLQSVGAGMRSLANLYTTLHGAPSAEPARAAEGGSSRRRLVGASGDGDDGKRLALARLRATHAEAMSRSRRADRVAEARIATMSRAQDRADARQQADDERAERRLAKQGELADARIAASRRRAEAASRPKKGASQVSRQSTVTWVDPGSGERYTVNRGTWEKSSHTLFDMIVESTRPAPDSRGYPTAQEWERHCRDTYGKSRDTRDAYIFHNLPGNRRALDYIRAMR